MSRPRRACSPKPATPSRICSAARIRRASTRFAGEPTPPPPYSPLENNCSGKHSGMLAYCVLCGLPKASYLAYDHPLQQAIRGAVAHFTSTPEDKLVSGIDGCSAPNYAVPLDRLALGFARLAARHDDARLRTCAADSCRRHDGASGNGVRRAAKRSRAHAGGARRLGGEDRRRRRAGHRPSRRRHRHRDQGGGRQQARVAAGRWRRSWSSWGSSMRARAPISPTGSSRSSTTTGDSSRDGSCPSVVLDKMSMPSWRARARRRAITLPRDELTVPVVVCRCKRAPHGAPDEMSGSGVSRA